MQDLESRGLGSITTRGGEISCFKFYNPNLHNIARSDRIRFKTKNPNIFNLVDNFRHRKNNYKSSYLFYRFFPCPNRSFILFVNMELT